MVNCGGELFVFIIPAVDDRCMDILLNFPWLAEI